MPSFLLSFELDQKRDCLSIHADEVGLRRLSELLLHVLDETPVGSSHEELLVLCDRKDRPLETRGNNAVCDVKICCWRGENPEA